MNSSLFNGKTASTEETVHYGMSKVDRYKWKSGTRPGELRMIHKSLIDIPSEYQRPQEAQEAKIRKIAADFSWPHFGALVVVSQGNGRFNACDGAGRLSAAKRRADVAEVPCIVFDPMSLKDEAEVFLGNNTLRKPVSAYSKFRALVVTENRAARAVDELVGASGRTFSEASSPTTVRCVALLLRLAEKDELRLRRLWPVIIEVCSGHAIHERIVDGLFYIDQHMQGGELLTDPKWRHRLNQLGAHALLIAANKAASFYTKGGSKVWARGIVEALNKGMRSRISLSTDGDE